MDVVNESCYFFNVLTDICILLMGIGRNIFPF